MAKQHAAQIKNDDTYEALRDKGYSKEKSARIANAQANDEQSPSKGGESKKNMKNVPRKSFTTKLKK